MRCLDARVLSGVYRGADRSSLPFGLTRSSAKLLRCSPHHHTDSEASDEDKHETRADAADVGGATAALQQPRHLSIAFETPALVGLAADQRATAIRALTVILLQAAGVPQTEDDDVERVGAEAAQWPAHLYPPPPPKLHFALFPSSPKRVMPSKSGTRVINATFLMK